MDKKIGGMVLLFALVSIFFVSGDFYDSFSLNTNSRVVSLSKHFFKQSSMRITMFATTNLYADMPYPFQVTVELEDTITDNQISGGSVTIMAHYFNGENPTWTSNFTATEGGAVPGFYSVSISHTGTGFYNFTAFAMAFGYEPSTASILREVKTRSGTGQPFGDSLNLLPLIVISIIVFAIVPILVFIFSQKMKRKGKL